VTSGDRIHCLLSNDGVCVCAHAHARVCVCVCVCVCVRTPSQALLLLFNTTVQTFCAAVLLSYKFCSQTTSSHVQFLFLIIGGDNPSDVGLMPCSEAPLGALQFVNSYFSFFALFYSFCVWEMYVYTILTIIVFFIILSYCSCIYSKKRKCLGM